MKTLQSSADDASLGSAGEFHRRLTLVSRDIVETVDALRVALMGLEQSSVSAIFERNGRPPSQIEFHCDTVDGQSDVRLTRGVRVLRGAEMIAAEDRAALEYAESDRDGLGLPPESSPTRRSLELGVLRIGLESIGLRSSRGVLRSMSNSLSMRSDNSMLRWYMVNSSQPSDIGSI